ncbi:tyrosyl-DNA phosphodiesterase domain-containing protein [Rhizoctonia solani AG-1 IA]|uniref:Tyrosyl-DNA phosphodiesterase domain-containing protein n=1 Tax=Thanatephorus cucumeris (strain AG1-IA) TaxID=983506 RepID=L8WQR9_THACA|nr:tyrosyl-DNA phosphodiesterase domain-containing protein [Rhizoctonia solani AG-1 IA]
MKMASVTWPIALMSRSCDLIHRLRSSTISLFASRQCLISTRILPCDAIQLSLLDKQPRATSSRNETIVIDSSDDDDVVEIVKPSNNRASSSATHKKTPALPKLTTTKRPQRNDEVLVLDTTIDVEDTDTTTESESENETLGLKVVVNSPEKGKSSGLSSMNTNNGNSGAELGSTLDPPTMAVLSPMAAFRAERIKMEQERLARLKRTRPASPPATTVSMRLNVKTRSPVHTPDSSAGSSSSYGGSFNVPDRSGLFWHGALRQTANKHITPAQDKQPIFRLTTDIIPPPPAPSSTSSESRNALSFVIVSSYALELPWLYQLFPPDVPVIVIAQPGQDGRAEVHHALPGWVRASPKLEGGRGCIYFTRLGVFGSLYLPPTSYPMTGGTLRTVWLQDIPLRNGPAPAMDQTAKGGSATEGFAKRLERVLKALNVAPALEAHLIDQQASGDVRLPLRAIGRWDWSRVTAHLVPSVAGKHAGWPSVLNVGHVALMKAVRDMGAASDSVSIECQGSSIGTYSTSWTNEFMSSAKGVSPDTYLDTPKSRRSKAPHPPGLKIIFPSLRTVDESILGRSVGEFFDSMQFPQKDGVKLMTHLKMILGIPADKETGSDKPKAWLYVGSVMRQIFEIPQLIILQESQLYSICVGSALCYLSKASHKEINWRAGKDLLDNMSKV